MFMHPLLFTKFLTYVFENPFQEASQKSHRRYHVKLALLWPKSLMSFCMGETLCHVTMYGHDMYKLNWPNYVYSCVMDLGTALYAVRTSYFLFLVIITFPQKKILYHWNESA